MKFVPKGRRDYSTGVGAEQSQLGYTFPKLVTSKVSGAAVVHTDKSDTTAPSLTRVVPSVRTCCSSYRSSRNPLGGMRDMGRPRNDPGSGPVVAQVTLRRKLQLRHGKGHASAAGRYLGLGNGRRRATYARWTRALGAVQRNHGAGEKETSSRHASIHPRQSRALHGSSTRKPGRAVFQSCSAQCPKGCTGRARYHLEFQSEYRDHRSSRSTGRRCLPWPP